MKLKQVELEKQVAALNDKGACVCGTCTHWDVNNKRATGKTVKGTCWIDGLVTTIRETCHQWKKHK